MLRSHFRGFQFVLFVAHAPNSASPEQLQWWEQTDQIVAALNLDSPLFVLMDANARVGSIQTVAAGPRYPDPEDPPGKAMHQFLLTHSLCLPATFVAEAPSGTWMSRSGRLS
jgi:hypothetical protein